MLRSILFIPVIVLMLAGCAKKDVAQGGDKKSGKVAGSDQKVFENGELKDASKNESGVPTKQPVPNANDIKGNITAGNEKHNSGNYDAAIDYYNKAIKADPNNSDAYLNRGISKVKAGKPGDGCEDLKMALKLGNTSAQETIDILCK